MLAADILTTSVIVYVGPLHPSLALCPASTLSNKPGRTALLKPRPVLPHQIQPVHISKAGLQRKRAMHVRKFSKKDLSPKMIRDCAHLAVRSTDYKNVAPNLTGKQKKSGFALTTICALLALQDHCDCFRLPFLPCLFPLHFRTGKACDFFASQFISQMFRREKCATMLFDIQITSERVNLPLRLIECAHRLQQCQKQAGL